MNFSVVNEEANNNKLKNCDMITINRKNLSKSKLIECSPENIIYDL